VRQIKTGLAVLQRRWLSMPRARAVNRRCGRDDIYSALPMP